MATISRSDRRSPAAGSSGSVSRNSNSSTGTPPKLDENGNIASTGSPFIDFLIDQTESAYNQDFKYDTFTIPGMTLKLRS